MKNIIVLTLLMVTSSSYAENYNERVINQIINVNQGWSQPKVDCPSCYRKQIIKNATCDRSFEKQFDSVNSPILQRILHVGKQSTLIKDSCFEYAQLNMNGPFASCQPGQRESVAQSRPPCVNSRYTGAVRKSFDLAYQCLHSYIDPDVDTAKALMKDMFYMMAVESGLHINARSPTKAGGLGQLTGGAIEHMNNVEMPMVKDILRRSDDNECADVANMMKQPMRPQVSNSCDRIALDQGSPLKNIIYTIAVQKNNRRSLLSKGLKLDAYRLTIFKKMMGKDVNELASKLSVVAHNAGVAGTTYPLREYLRYLDRKGIEVISKNPGPGQISINQFMAGFRPFMKMYPHPANAKRKDPSEPVAYFTKIMTQKLNINSYAGGGSCEIK